MTNLDSLTRDRRENHEAPETKESEMGLRLTTWNVNGIRNPFQYQPWRGKKTFEAMFGILEADIVVFQETKIQRKDLRDDMVLVNGWDCYWSLPRHKKGYSGVVIYTRQSVCAPIRAEEGITGILCPPNSSTSFSTLPEDQQIGGYPSPAQLASSAIDASTIDSEGRCVILEFPAFVLLGVYSPANRDESRDEFRIGFLNLLDARIRNLISIGKRVVLMGDLNISREELDTANAESSMRKNGLTVDEYISTPSRRLFNQLLHGGKVLGERDEGREMPVMWDICRGFHPGRKGMFTCWEQKTNARPANCGARIDYVICSLPMKNWFSDSNIQEGLMGSDHCPVYAVIKSKVTIAGEEIDLLDLMNPPGMFSHGHRQREYSTKDILPLSGKLIPEFDGRRNIRDMFTRKTIPSQSHSSMPSSIEGVIGTTAAIPEVSSSAERPAQSENKASPDVPPTNTSVIGPTSPINNKRSIGEVSKTKPLKRAKSGVAPSAPTTGSKSQQSLKGFFKPSLSFDGTLEAQSPNKATSSFQSSSEPSNSDQPHLSSFEPPTRSPSPETHSPDPEPNPATKPLYVNPSKRALSQSASTALKAATAQDQDDVHDPIETKESWSKLFTKPAAPRCEGHNEPCISLLTKKSGMNCGRSFWMCPRPLGPTGMKERNTQWRCQTFIWCSDWNSINSREITEKT